ncbi:MAG: hypothetical protein HQL74_03110 [Magnetococcales bacterium]|nr:hypothetical protein [Magnetococcales bacterium]
MTSQDSQSQPTDDFLETLLDSKNILPLLPLGALHTDKMRDQSTGNKPSGEKFKHECAAVRRMRMRPKAYNPIIQNARIDTKFPWTKPSAQRKPNVDA